MSLLLDITPLRRSPEFRRLWWGLGISNLGAQLTQVAVGLQVYALTGSSLAVGVLGICALVPLVALGLYGGALTDLYDRRKVALIASSGLWLISLALAVQAWSGASSVYLLYGLVAAQSAGFAINNPARSAIIPRLVGPELLPAANVLQTTAWNVALTVGPLLGAFLSAWNFGAAYTLDVVLFTAALWALWRLPDLPPLPDPETGENSAEDAPAGADPNAAGRPRRRPLGFASVLEGLRYLATRPNVRTSFLVDLIAMITAMPRVLYPAVGVLFLGGGANTTGMLNAAFAIGAVLAGLLSGRLVQVRMQGRVIIGAIISYGLAVASFGLVLTAVGGTTPEHTLIIPLIGAAVCLAVCGGADSISSVFRNTLLQSATPDRMRGRLQGVFIVVVAGGPRLGDLVLGSWADWWGENWAAVVGGFSCVALICLAALWQRRFLAYDARDPQP
ncbi:MFS transporter [Microlunatus soli]|uniref:Predicted arabinose efflux permease, MFS family n=1 Tax=Microlunatus soli TaxID=630515 RepID=A0A1H1PZZ9_9ACTN|nr:MFS transporter [Microlunatus soli]SDS16567.1 Predicted arabinose efflux permease, MFS family [Microlunatus soli]